MSVGSGRKSRRIPSDSSQGPAAQHGAYATHMFHSYSRVRGRRLDPYAVAVLQTIRDRRLAGPDDGVLVAASGGPDSTALLAALAQLRDAGEVGPIGALHVDHGLRPGVDAEAAVVRRTCERLGVPFRSVGVEVGPGNVQAAARSARYAALRREASRTGAGRIATGHTRTDQAETVLLRLARGAGARGLAAIPPRRGPIIRPLIDRSRAEGLAFLARQGLDWCEDPTNASPRYTRNRLRQALWPALLSLNPAAEAALARSADLLRDDDRALSARARRLLAAAGAAADGPETASLRGAPLAVQRRVVRRLAKEARGGAAPGADHVARVLRLVASGRPGRTGLPGGLEARVAAGRLVIGRPCAPAGAPPFEPVAVDGPGRYAVPALGLEVEVTAPAGTAVPWRLALRTRRPGDTFRPAGRRGGKRLKAWLIDRKVARARRDRLLLLVDGAGRVLAIPELGVTGDGLPRRVAVRVLARR
jgi:tRNA(Ile)-lysidine synthase